MSLGLPSFMMPVADGSGMDTLIQRGIMLGTSGISALPDPTPPNEGTAGLHLYLNFWE
jgi:hypothetical protein